MLPTLLLAFGLMLPILFNLWSIRHAFKHDFPSEKEKKIWIRLATFLPVVGGLVYLLWGRPRALPPGTAGSRLSRRDDA